MLSEIEDIEPVLREADKKYREREFLDVGSTCLLVLSSVLFCPLAPAAIWMG